MPPFSREGLTHYQNNLVELRAAVTGKTTEAEATRSKPQEYMTINPNDYVSQAALFRIAGLPATRGKALLAELEIEPSAVIGRAHVYPRSIVRELLEADSKKSNDTPTAENHSPAILAWSFHRRERIRDPLPLVRDHRQR